VEEAPQLGFGAAKLPAGGVTCGGVSDEGAVPLPARAFIVGVLAADKPSGQWTSLVADLPVQVGDDSLAVPLPRGGMA
jgi:hypothetical protein